MELNQEIKYWEKAQGANKQYKLPKKYESKVDPFIEYLTTFIQRLPWYVVKQIGGTWKTKKKPLSDIPIKAHLNGQYYVGVFGKWYPGYAIFDFDDTSRDVVERKREMLGLDDRNSMLMNSESSNSCHLLFRSAYKQRPPTIRLLNQILKPWANENGIEIYPQANRPIRLPFGSGQDCLDIDYLHLKKWEDKLYWFNKLDEFELKNFPLQQLQFEFNDDINLKPNGSTFSEGRFLYENGLVGPHSRHASQFKVLYYLHMNNNITPETAIDLIWHWIKNKHNGYSKEVNAGNWRKIKEEIERQAISTYGKYERIYYYPNEINNKYNGYVTKADIHDIVMIRKASLPNAKFLFQILKYGYPRRFRTFIDLHSETLLQWSNVKGYQKQLEDLQRLEIVKRYDSYKVKAYSKSIKIKWNWKDTSKAILVDGRAPETLDDTIRACFEPEELRELLTKAGSERDTAGRTVRRLYEADKRYNNI